MGRIEKTVFISYRRTNLPWALFVYQNLTMHGYDVFFDYQSIDSGNFESVILDNIRARVHFIVILTPSALENCNKPSDWLRREIEIAMDENRNIVPLMVENFDFGSPLVKEALTGKLAKLNTYNGLPVPNAYALEAMERLRERFLNKTLNDVSMPALQLEAQRITDNQKTAANEAAPVQDELLTAQTWYERGYVFWKDGNLDEAIRCFTESIHLSPKFHMAYFNRGAAYSFSNNFNKAIKDYSIAIKLKPSSSEHGVLLLFRGDTYNRMGKFDKAIADFSEANRFIPDLAEAYYYRGNSHVMKQDIKKARSDYSKAIRLKSDYSKAYFKRGLIRQANKDLDGALSDFNKSIRYHPDDSKLYISRGQIFARKGNIEIAIKDFNKAVRLNPNATDAYFNRALTQESKGNLNGALKDYNYVTKLDQNHIYAIYNRALLWESKKAYSSAISDYEKYLELGGGEQERDQKEVEEKIKKLKTKLAKKKLK